jgi:Kef-type K+ transport system membrane component KefB
MNSQDFVKLALQITTMLGCALFFGEIMRRLKQPAVVGEMFGGIVLGPTVFGLLAPALYGWMFLSSSNVAVVRDASIKLGMLFFLFYAGLEVDLSDLRKQGKRTILIGLIGTLVPIAAGVGLVYALPRDFWGEAVQQHFFSFALFIGMNLANSANPVIARILMDLGLLKGPIGTLIMSATIVDDLVNWTLFAVILRDIAPSSAAAGGSLFASLGLVALFFVGVLGVGRWLGPRFLHWVRPRVAWPSGFIALTALLVLMAGSASEALGIHAFLGAFLVGVALGGGDAEQKEAHDVVGHFVLSFFAPIYFISMGMTTNFIKNFDPILVVLIFVVACITKVGGVLLGAKAAGMRLDREAWAVGFGLNARGATGIILAGVGLANHVIDERIFVAIVVMALLTSLMSGPLMSRLLWHRQVQRVRPVAPSPAMETS